MIVRTTENTWTDDRVDVLKELYAAGEVNRAKIAAEINSRTGSSFAPNSIGGKLFRLFGRKNPILTPEEKAAAKEASRQRKIERKRAKRAAEREKQRRIGSAFRPRGPRAPASNPNLFLVETSPLLIGVLELTEYTCKFECTGREDPSQFLFCGHTVKAGKPYCPAHCAIAYEPPPERKSKKPYHRLGMARGGVFGRVA